MLNNSVKEGDLFILINVAYKRVNLLGKLENKMSYNSNSNNKWLQSVHVTRTWGHIILWCSKAEPLSNMLIALKQWSYQTS